MTFGDVAGAAIRHARDGFAVFPYLAEDIAENADALERWPSVGAIFAPGGRPLSVGDRLVQADLAATIQHMADEEAAAPGDRAAGLEAARAAFYEGDIAAAIVAHQRDQGGLLDRDDLAAFRSRYEPPVRIRWRDFEVLTCGPWCQGPVLAQALRMLEAAGPMPRRPPRRRPHPSGHRGAEGGVRGSRVPLRRPGDGRRRARRAAIRHPRPRPPGGHRHAAGGAGDAAAARPAL